MMVRSPTDGRHQPPIRMFAALKGHHKIETQAPSKKWGDFDYSGSSHEALFKRFRTSEAGLSEHEALRRLREYGPNEPVKKKRHGPLFQLATKFLNPLIIVLMIVGFFTLIVGELASAGVILAMILLSVTIGFVQEYRSGREAEKLAEMVRTTATVLRGGKHREISIKKLVPGDVISLAAGDLVPADVRVLTCKDLYVNQSALTGESFPVDKCSNLDDPASDQVWASDIALMGTSVVSGAAAALVIKTGASTQFGAVAQELVASRPPTSFDRGIRDFSLLMIRSTMVMVLVIFAINALFRGTLIEAFLFSLAVAVGLTPEMLPTIVAVNLTKGASELAKKKVIVKHLNSIQNFGAMDILCTDKTGTLTLDQVVLIRHCDVTGADDETVLLHAYLNSFYETGLKNLLDHAVIAHQKLAIRRYTKIDEIPFDFNRRIMSVVVDYDGGHRLITKGAPEEIFLRCDRYELGGKILPIDSLHLPGLQEQVEKLNHEGFRVLAVAYKDTPADRRTYSKDDEQGLVLKGYVAFLDPPKPTARHAIESLQALGIRIKVLSGDNATVTTKICSEVGLTGARTLTGEMIETMDDAALAEAAEKENVFARMSPVQKERVIRILQKQGHTVGFLGDGINDAASLKVADVGISVNNAVDIAKESAELILLEKDLNVLRDGVIGGRRIFANIVKYVRMGASSNFGNMVSMTGASLFLPFVPMAPMQILLNNFLYDLSQVTIPTDNVDPEYLTTPKPWNVRAIKRFMVVIGPVSSVFDFLTFGIGLYIFHAPVDLFRTFWFIESLWTQTLVIHVIRTAKKPFLESIASKPLRISSLLIIATGMIIPLTPLAGPLGFIRPPLTWYPVLIGLVALYLVITQVVKEWFIKKYGYD